MSIISRTAVAAAVMLAAFFSGTFWLYLKGTAESFIENNAGVFLSNWEFLEWAFPTACYTMAAIAGIYLVFGGAQEERKRKTRRVR